MKKSVHLLMALVAACMSNLIANVSMAASNGVVVESVNNYASTNCTPSNGCATCSSGDLCNSITNGDGFLSQITAAGLVRTADWTNNLVYDTDFQDSDKCSPCYDSGNFDQPGVAVSYFTGHGINATGFTYQDCTATSQCNSPPAGTSMPSSCVAMPSVALHHGRCAYTDIRSIVTHGGGDAWHGLVYYGGQWGMAAKWGESPNAGAWAGAGSYGGTNMVVLDISWASIPGLQYMSLVPALAGAHMIAATQPTWGDTANVADRGPAFGRRAALNLSGSMFRAWMDAMNDLPSREGTACNGDYAYGGGHGFNGCGCNVVVTADTTQSSAQFHTRETLNDLQNDANDARGLGWWYWAAQCNYDAFGAYPWSL